MKRIQILEYPGIEREIPKPNGTHTSIVAPKFQRLEYRERRGVLNQRIQVLKRLDMISERFIMTKGVKERHTTIGARRWER